MSENAIGSEAWFQQLRFDKNHHLGMGDVRLSMAQTEDISSRMRSLTSELAQAQADVARYEGQVRDYPDSYLGKIFFQGVEEGKAEAQADMEALEKAIRNALDEMGDNREVILEQALAEHLRGATDE